MPKEISTEDETYKYIIKKLGIRFHKRLGYDGNSIEFKNVELTPLASENKFMDIFYEVDGEYNTNIELQSSPVYESKMIDMYKYDIYSESEDGMLFKTCVFATHNPNYGIEELAISENIDFHPRFFYTKNQNAKEFLSIIKNKVKNEIALLDSEAIDLIITPDMEHDFDIKQLLEYTSELLVNAVIPDKMFHLDLLDCQKKMLQRFLKVDERKEVEKMLKLKAEDYGLEPNVTGFEESVNLAYLDGKREGYDDGKRDGYDNAILETARNMIDEGVSEDIVSKTTGLDLKTIRKLK
jgi:hypothetical protein